MDKVKSNIYYILKDWRYSGISVTTVTALASSIIFLIFSTVLLFHSKFYASMWLGIPLLLAYYLILFMATTVKNEESRSKILFWTYSTVGYYGFVMIALNLLSVGA